MLPTAVFLVSVSLAAARAQDSFLVRAEDQPATTEERPRRDGWIHPPLPDAGRCLLQKTFSRSDGPLAWELEFELGEEAVSEFALEFAGTEGARVQFGVVFDPFAGGNWHYTYQNQGEPKRRSLLTPPPEPPDLKFKFRLVLPAAGGLLVTDPQSRPLIATRFGAVDTGQFELTRRGPVHNVRFTPPAREESAVNPALHDLVQASVPPVGDWYTKLLDGPPPAVDSTPAPASPEPVTPIALLPPRTGFSPHDVNFASQVAGELRLDAFTIEVTANSEVPVLLVGPDHTEPAGAVFLWHDWPEGKFHHPSVELAAHLATAGLRVLIPDFLGCGVRRQTQNHDGFHDLRTVLVGVPLSHWLGDEAEVLLGELLGHFPVDSKALTLLAFGGASLPAREVQQRIAFQHAFVDPTAAAGQRTISILHRQPKRFSVATRVSDSQPAPIQRLSANLDQDVRDFAATILQQIGVSSEALELSEELLDSLDRAVLQLQEESELIWPLRWSWLLDHCLHQADTFTRPTSVDLSERIAFALQLAALAGERRRWDDVKLDSQARCLTAAMVTGSTAQSAIAIQYDHNATLPAKTGGLLDPGSENITVAISQFGRLRALEESTSRLPAREGEVWVALSPRGLEQTEVSQYELACLSSHHGPPLLAHWLLELEWVLEQFQRRTEGPVRFRLVGEGIGGLVALLASAREPARVESVTLVHPLPSLRKLLEIDPDRPVAGPPSPHDSEHAHPAYFVPGMLALLEIEDLALELRKQEVPVIASEPVDAFFSPLSRRDRRAMWPRIQHLKRQQEKSAKTDPATKKSAETKPAGGGG